MAALKVTSTLCLSLLVMTLLLDPSCGNKEPCDEWSSDTYRMLLLCSSKTCSKHCISEGATRGKCGFLIFRSFCFCTKECD
ncbi:hypothetical protein SORBI_3008G167400 [Sorghum bicolor]|nr:hypothetical protein SORBI_3008G167400 [Sorghum bicolor]